MKNLDLDHKLAWYLFVFCVLAVTCSSSCTFPREVQKEEAQKTEEPENLTLLTLDTLKNLGIISTMMPKLQFFTETEMIATRKIPSLRSVTVTDGRVIEKVVQERIDTLYIPGLTKLIVINYFTDQNTVVYRVGLEQDASINNRKYLFIGPDKEGFFLFYTKKEKDKEVLEYGGERYELEGGNSNILFSLSQEAIPSRGSVKILKGKDLSLPPPDKKN